MSQALVETGVRLLFSQALPRDGRRRVVSRPLERGPRALGKGAGVDDEQALLERACGGDPAAFDALFRSHASDVARVCRRMLGSESAAQDAAQEVFLRARRGVSTYDPQRPFRRWLLGITSHHCVDQLRRRSREAGIFDARELDAADLSDPGASPLRQALDAERRERVLHAIDALPQRYRIPLALRYFEELDYDGIAEVLGLSRSQVGTLLFRAKRRLREQLSGGAR